MGVGYDASEKLQQTVYTLWVSMGVLSLSL